MGYDRRPGRAASTRTDGVPCPEAGWPYHAQSVSQEGAILQIPEETMQTRMLYARKSLIRAAQDLKAAA
jgi:hypothetical protein